MSNKNIVILASSFESTKILYNSLRDDFNIEKVIIENHIPLGRYFKRRIKTLGFLTVIGQILFLLVVVPLLKKFNKKRICEIKKKYDFADNSIKKSKVINLTSVNSKKAIKILREINPSIIIVNGTRIISEAILKCIPAKFVNIHVGITPLYRGLHGGYWALTKNDRKNCGVTVHLVDAGIDTGNILGQALIHPTKADNFVTYPLLQLVAVIPLLKKVIEDAFNDKLQIKPYPEGSSKFWSHPTIWTYLLNRICNNTK